MPNRIINYSVIFFLAISLGILISCTPKNNSEQVRLADKNVDNKKEITVSYSGLPKPNKSGFSSSLLPKNVSSAPIEIINIESSKFPVVSMKFRLFNKSGEPICRFNKKKLVFNNNRPSYDNPIWGAENALALNKYLAVAPASKTGIISLETLKPGPNEILGRLLFLVSA